eukprot:COSAG01_NODE_5785_length_4034_cov_4.877255_2_plen_70_part_00
MLQCWVRYLRRRPQRDMWRWELGRDRHGDLAVGGRAVMVRARAIKPSNPLRDVAPYGRWVHSSQFLIAD